MAPLNLMSSPSYHHISPLARSRSELYGASSLRRSHSLSSHSKFTMPQYGYGGGYMSRTLSRSGSTLFGRSLQSSVLTKTPPLHSVAVQRSTPHYSDKYPYVRYSYGNTDTGLSILSQSNSLSNDHISVVRDMGTKRWLEGKLNAYNTGLFSTPNYNARVERPIAPTRNYIRYMPIEDAMSMYKKRCMTVGTLSKYWLSPTTWQSRREKEMNLSAASAHGDFSYASRYSNYPSYRNIARRLQTY